MKYTIKTTATLAALREPGNLLLAARTATMAIAVIAFYFQDLAIVFSDALRNEATSYIVVVPILLVYLLARAKNRHNNKPNSQRPRRTRTDLESQNSLPPEKMLETRTTTK